MTPHGSIEPEDHNVRLADQRTMNEPVDDNPFIGDMNVAPAAMTDQCSSGEQWHLVERTTKTVPSMDPAICKCTDGLHDWQKGMWVGGAVSIVREHNDALNNRPDLGTDWRGKYEREKKALDKVLELAEFHNDIKSACSCHWHEQVIAEVKALRKYKEHTR